MSDLEKVTRTDAQGISKGKSSWSADDVCCPFINTSKPITTRMQVLDVENQHHVNLKAENSDKIFVMSLKSFVETVKKRGITKKSKLVCGPWKVIRRVGDPWDDIYEIEPFEKGEEDVEEETKKNKR